MLNVKINVHPFELNSVLDKLHQWSSQYDWDGVSGQPSIVVDLNVIEDHRGLAEKFSGNRFEPQEPESVDHKVHVPESESLQLMDFLKRGGASRA